MKKFALCLWAIILPTIALAQGPQRLCYTTNGENCITVSPTNPLPVIQSGSTGTNITTNTDTNVKASPGTFVGISVNTAGTTSTAKVYNDADGTCSSGLIATFSTTSVGSIMIGANMSIGICVKTAGAGAADITILYR